MWEFSAHTDISLYIVECGYMCAKSTPRPLYKYVPRFLARFPIPIRVLLSLHAFWHTYVVSCFCWFCKKKKKWNKEKWRKIKEKRKLYKKSKFVSLSSLLMFVAGPPLLFAWQALLGKCLEKCAEKCACVVAMTVNSPQLEGILLRRIVFKRSLFIRISLVNLMFKIDF